MGHYKKSCTHKRTIRLLGVKQSDYFKIQDSSIIPHRIVSKVGEADCKFLHVS